jgi:hypothetical protein
MADTMIEDTSGRAPFLTDGRRTVMSEISRDVAQVFFASLVIGFLVLDQDIGLMIRGLILSIGYWVLNIVVINK